MDVGKLVKDFSGELARYELNLSVDCVIFTILDQRLKVLINKPLPKLSWVLPGNFMHKNEEANNAAIRVLKQRTGVKNVYLNQFGIFSDPDRFSFQKLFSMVRETSTETISVSMLPERVVSIGFFSLVNHDSINVTGGDLQEETCWADIQLLPALMFDHKRIIEEAVKALRKEVYFKPITHKLLPEKFTMPELQQLYEIILDKPLDRSSFQKKMLKWNIYERLEERREGVAHKRPYLYRFDQNKFSEGLRQGIRFGL